MRELVLNPPTVSNSCLDLASSITFAKKRVDALEAYRIKRLLNNCSEGFQTVFSLLPVLIHYNHPSLLCYTENAPYGLYDFHLDSTQQKYLESLIEQPLFANRFAQFDALYVMGSLGSVTQNSLSDIDLWLCRSLPLCPNQEKALNDKLDKIKNWAKSLGVDIHFYLMNPEEFSAREYRNDISTENSGSAQHYLLLDEFYRSAIRLAGKRVLWLHMLDRERPYTEVIAEGVSQRIIRLDEWIDFGDFSDLSLSEYFGASLWQLYKGINSPYKSAIKIFLLESYAETYPDTHLISRKFKQLLLSDQAVSYHFDPYLAMLEQVTIYLEKRKEFNRLECLRYCFYVKATEGQLDDWRRQELRKLAFSWGWHEQEMLSLEAKSEWKIKQAMRHQKMLVAQLLQSYRNLINFARKFHIDPSIMPQDTDLLMRKLYSVFEISPGKVELINGKIAKNLGENELTFVEVTENSATKAGWYLINHAPLSAYDSNKRYVQYHKSLNKLVAWAYFNGILTVNSQLHLVSQTVSLSKLRQFIADLRLSFPAQAPKMTDDDLYHPNEIRNLIVAVNLTKDPTTKLRSRRELSQIDLLNLSLSNQGVIGSVSVMYRNMWNEIITQHIEGQDSILKALKLISNKIYRSSAPPQSVSVFCYSSQLRNELQKFVTALVHRCISVQTGTMFEKQSYTFKLAGKKWQFVFNQQVELKELPLDEQKNERLNAPKVIYNFASEGFLQFFFEDNPDETFNVYALDKQNHLETYLNCIGRKEEKITRIIRSYTENDNSESADYIESFNYPQFYQLLKEANETIIVPFQSKRHRDYIQNM
ncbi:class I adenylate cyclase [Frederiksenia canicola]